MMIILIELLMIVMTHHANRIDGVAQPTSPSLSRHERLRRADLVQFAVAMPISLPADALWQNAV